MSLVSRFTFDDYSQTNHNRIALFFDAKNMPHVNLLLKTVLHGVAARLYSGIKKKFYRNRREKQKSDYTRLSEKQRGKIKHNINVSGWLRENLRDMPSRIETKAPGS